MRASGRLLLLLSTLAAAARLSRSSAARGLAVVGYCCRNCPGSPSPSPSSRSRPQRTRTARVRNLTTMSAAAAASSPNDGGGLLGFLRQARAALLAAHQQQEQDTPRQQLKVVIGNEAADADSVVSAITLAYFLSAQHPGVQYVPVLSLPRAEMKLRPETLLLLRLAGAAEEEGPAAAGERQRHLTFLDEADLPALAQKCPELKVVLVDHNRLCRALQPALDGRVEAIVDHHEDKGHYPWVQEADREVAFEGGFNGGGGTGASSLSAAPSLAGGIGGLDGSLGGSLSLTRSSSAVGKALVASTCTLVAERFLARAPQLLLQPPSGGGGGNVAALLLGVVMLDAAGLDPMAGKVTERDLAAVAALERVLAAGGSVGGGGSAGVVGVGEKMALYKRLSGAKFDREWWGSLRVHDALRLDYKAFTAHTAQAGPLRFGMSSVLVPVEDILLKEGPPAATAVLRAFAAERGVRLLVLMSLVMDAASGAMQRGLAIYAPERALGAALVERLLSPETEGPALALAGAGEGRGDAEGGGLWVFGQGNAQASRKQVEPIVRVLLEDPALAFAG